MLILCRREGESIIIYKNDGSGDIIRIMNTLIKGNQVRLGCEAGQHWSIDREEIYLRKQQDRLEGRTYIPPQTVSDYNFL